jgi:serine/threonine-protein phosphatase PGAM5
LGTRTLLLVRHGQYDVEDEGRLTEIGRQQATATGRFITTLLATDSEAKLGSVDALWSSTLPRARETASILTKTFATKLNIALKVRPTGVLREGMYSKLKGFDVTERERDEDRARGDVAYGRFFRTSRADRLEILVCHGNLIRYLICKAMHVPVGRWTRMNSSHCGLTRVLVRATGAVRVVSYNETAHLPPKLVT